MLSIYINKTVRLLTPQPSYHIPNFLYTMPIQAKWYENVAEISAIHNRKSLENPGWTMNDTRILTGYSIGYVSESLKLARAIKDNPRLTDCADRETALSKLRPKLDHFPNNTKVLVKFGNLYESGVVVGRGTINLKETVWIVQLDQPFLFERVYKRMQTVVARIDDLKELTV